MSYDICIKDADSGDVAELPSPHFIAGGTYAAGGTTQAHLNITYNYATHFHKVLGDGGVRSIYGKRAGDTINTLLQAAAQLADDYTGDYWEGTEGNAKKSLLQLVALAQLVPDGIWDGD